MVTSTDTASRKSLREEHVERTRERLIDAAIELLITGGPAEFSLREVAKLAGVSAPTAYRHFPTKESLYEALRVYFEARIYNPESVASLDHLIDVLPAIHRSLVDNARLLRAYVRSNTAGEFRLKGRKRRGKWFAHLTKAVAPSLAQQEVDAFAAMLHLFASSATWELWTDIWQLEGEQAGRVAAWAVRALRDALRKNPAAFAAAVKGEGM